MGSPTEVTTTQHTLSFVIKQTSSQDDIVTGSTHTQRGGDARVRVAEGHLRILAITDGFSQRNILGHNLQTRQPLKKVDRLVDMMGALKPSSTTGDCRRPKP